MSTELRPPSTVSPREVRDAKLPREELLRRARRSVREGAEGKAHLFYRRAMRGGALEGADRRVMAKLSERRLRIWLDSQDMGAWQEWQRLQSLDPQAAKGLAPQVLRLRALLSLRHSSEFRRQEGKELLGRDLLAMERRSLAGVLDLAPNKEDEPTLDELLATFRWLDRGRAWRLALQLGQRYVDRGGRNPALIQRWLELHRWWSGSSKVALPTELGRQLPKEARDTGLRKLLDGLCSTASPAGPAPSADAALETLRRPLSPLSLGLQVVDALMRAGRGKAAQAVSLAILEESPESAALALLVSLASTQYNPDGSLLYAQQAAAASGDAGRYFLWATATHVESGRYVSALTLGRQAIAHSADETRFLALWFAARAQEALGRSEDAASTLNYLRQEPGAGEMLEAVSASCLPTWPVRQAQSEGGMQPARLRRFLWDELRLEPVAPVDATGSRGGTTPSAR